MVKIVSQLAAEDFTSLMLYSFMHGYEVVMGWGGYFAAFQCNHKKNLDYNVQRET